MNVRAPAVRAARRARGLALLASAWVFSQVVMPAASLVMFAPIFSQVTNDLATVQNSFDGSNAQKQRLALLAEARSAALEPGLRDDQALARFVFVLSGLAEYAENLDQSATNARTEVLASYEALALRVADLPPGLRSSVARGRFQALAADRTALSSAVHATNISTRLTSFGPRMARTGRLVTRAAAMRPSSIPMNAVRATLNGKPFVSTGDGLHSPNIFSVNASTSAYRGVFCRVVDRAKVLTFTLPVVTSLTRYEVAQGLAAAMFVPDIFATNVVTLHATGGTFSVQRDRDEVFGLFSCQGPGLNIKDGRFRIRLRGN